MKDRTKELEPLGFRTDDDFGSFVADVEECKEHGEAFYMCPKEV